MVKKIAKKKPFAPAPKVKATHHKKKKCILLKFVAPEHQTAGTRCVDSAIWAAFQNSSIQRFSRIINRKPVVEDFFCVDQGPAKFFRVLDVQHDAQEVFVQRVVAAPFKRTMVRVVQPTKRAFVDELPFWAKFTYALDGLPQFRHPHTGEAVYIWNNTARCEFDASTAGVMLR